MSKKSKRLERTKLQREYKVFQMAIKAIDPFNQREYVPYDELGKTDPGTIIVQDPDLDVTERIDNSAVDIVVKGDNTSHKITTGTQKKETLLACVKGTKNIKDSNGNEIPFDISTLDAIKRSLSRIPPHHRDEVYNDLRGNHEANKAARERAIERLTKQYNGEIPKEFAARLYV